MLHAMKRIKVAYLLRTLNIGGAERYVVETATGLDQQRFEPLIYCISGSGELQTQAEERGVAVRAYHAPHCRSLRHFWEHAFWYAQKFQALSRFLQTEQPDIVHCYMFSPSLYGAVAAKLTGRAVVLTNRMSLGRFKDGRPHYQMMENLINRVVDGVLVNSEALKQDVLQRERIALEKIHVVYGGVDTRRFIPTDGNAEQLRLRHSKRAELGIPVNAPVIAMIANLRDCKGYQEFIEAAASIHQDYPDAYFLCIGEDRGLLPLLEQQRNQSGLEGRVLFTGQIQHITDYFPMIDIQVSASHEEGFSSSILEGMASGKPIVATAVGGTPEAVVPETTGLLVPPKDAPALARAIKRLLADPQTARAFGEQGRKRVETHFDTARMHRALEELYWKLVQLRRSDAA